VSSYLQALFEFAKSEINTAIILQQRPQGC